MSPYSRWPRAHAHPPAPLDGLTRAQVIARVDALREALALLALQADLDGGTVFPCVGAMRKHLIHLEHRLGGPRAEPGAPLPLAVALAMVGRAE